MFGVSFFGVTPGFTHKDFCSDAALPSIIQECAGLYTLDQFTVRLPRNGTLYIFGGRMVDARHVTFIGLYRHAIEYKGSREGGHYGVGIWLVDAWLDSEVNVLGFLDEMMEFLSDQLVNAEGRVIQTFEQMDWGAARAFQQRLDGYCSDPGPFGDDVFFDGKGRKFLLVHEKKINDPDSMRALLSQMVKFFGRAPAILRDRVIYTSFDASIIQAFRDLNRVEIISYADFVEQYDRESRRSGLTSDADQPQSPFVPTDDDGQSDRSSLTTIRIHDDNGDNAWRSTARSSSKSTRTYSRFQDKPPGFNRSTSDVLAQMLTRANLTAGMLVIVAVLVLSQSLDIFGFRSSAPSNSRYVAERPLTKESPKEIDRKRDSSNATNSGTGSPCQRGDSSLIGPPPNPPDIRQSLNRIKERFEAKEAKQGTYLVRRDLDMLSPLVQRELAYLNCLDEQLPN